jgi:hypothetical protein
MYCIINNYIPCLYTVLAQLKRQPHKSSFLMDISSNTGKVLVLTILKVQDDMKNSYYGCLVY